MYKCLYNPLNYHNSYAIITTYFALANIVRFTLLILIKYSPYIFVLTGFDRTPHPVGARILTCAWFAFVTLTLVTYIGGLVYHFDWATRGYFRSLSPLGVRVRTEKGPMSIHNCIYVPRVYNQTI